MPIVDNAIRNDDISDTLARQGQGLTVGIADQRIIVIFCQIRYFDIIVYDLPIGLTVIR